MTPKFDTWQEGITFLLVLIITVTIGIILIEYDAIKAKHELKKKEKEHQKIYYTILAQSIHRY